MRAFDFLGSLMGVAIGRGSRGPEIIACTTSEVTTPVIEKRSFGSGSIRIPAGSPITSITFYGDHVSSGVFGAAKNEEQTALVIAVAAGEIHPLPLTLLGVPFYKMVTNAAGNVTVFHIG